MKKNEKLMLLGGLAVVGLYLYNQSQAGAGSGYGGSGQVPNSGGQGGYGGTMTGLGGPGRGFVRTR